MTGNISHEMDREPDMEEEEVVQRELRRVMVAMVRTLLLPPFVFIASPQSNTKAKIHKYRGQGRVQLILLSCLQSPIPPFSNRSPSATVLRLINSASSLSQSILDYDLSCGYVTHNDLLFPLYLSNRKVFHQA